MRNQHDRLLWLITQELAHPTRAFREGRRIRGVETRFAGPIRREAGEVEGGEFRVGFEVRAGGADVAVFWAAFLGLREADYGFDAEALDGRGKGVGGGLEGAAEGGGGDEVDFLLEGGEGFEEGGGLFDAEGGEDGVEDWEGGGVSFLEELAVWFGYFLCSVGRTVVF
jgi:hypothetical protein